MDLGPSVNADILNRAAAEYDGVSLAGEDTPTPYLRVGNMFFKGTVDRTLGTHMVFGLTNNSGDGAQQTRAQQFNSDASPSVSATYLGSAKRAVKFARVDLEPKVAEMRATTTQNVASGSTKETGGMVGETPGDTTLAVDPLPSKSKDVASMDLD
ncbi:hypothetical protein BJ742DRAFT_501590 [Cladochytrium replicatum]|nr:hypothetical protein BJ742DRAFT_501590 [Cladochytrium replicatum]